MSNIQIPNLPAASALSGDELFEAVQGGVSSKVTATQIATLASDGITTVTTFSGGTTGLTPASPTTGDVVLGGVLEIASGGTGQGTAAGAFNALSPITTTGDLIVGDGANSATRLPIGASGTILKSNGTTAAWAADAVGTVTSIDGSGGTTGLTVTGGPVTTSGTLTLGGTLAVANGGTGSTTASAARTALGVAIGTNVQAYDATLQSLSSLGTAADKIAYTTGVDTWAETAITSFGRSLIDDADASTARSTLGLGTISTQNANSVSISGGSVTGITDLAIADGGTGQSTAAAAFNALSPITSVGDVIIGNGVNSATRLAIGANGTVLTSNGTTAAWTAAAGTGTVTSIQVAGGSTGLSFSGGPITTSGTITMAGTLGIGYGGTGQTTATASFNALSPITSTGDLIIGNGANSATRLPIGTNGYILTSNGTTAVWTAVGGTGTVTSVDGSGGTTGLTLTGGPITAAGTLTLGGTLAIANGGTGATSAAAALTALGGISATSTSTLTNKSLSDSTTYFIDDADATKKVQFQVSGVATATTRTWTFPDASDTFVGLAATQTLTNKTLTSPTINGATLSGTLTGYPTLAGSITVTTGTATANTDFLVLRPSDYAAGKPQLSFFKSSTANYWSIGLWDTVNFAGTINFNSATGLTWNNVQLVDLSTAQTLTNKTLTSPTLGGTVAGSYTSSGLNTISRSTATSNTDYVNFQPTDYGAGKPKLYVNKDSTASIWNISLFDTVDSSGTINFVSATALNWNGNQLTTNVGTQTLTNKTITAPVLSGTVTGTYTIGGTPTFPSTVVLTTGAQTLSSKTLTSPIISTISNTGTLTLPTSTDTLVGRATTDTLTNKTITATKEVKVAMAANDIDLSLANYFSKTISGTTTLTVSNVPATGTAISIILDLTNGGSAAITWWSGMKWAGGAAPSLTSSGRDILGFFTYDGGTTWNGLLLGKGMA